MKKLLCMAFVGLTSLASAFALDPYISTYFGVGGEDVGVNTDYMSYYMQARPALDRTTNVVEEDGEFQDYLVNVSGKDLLGIKSTIAIGLHLAKVYRVEAELSFAEDAHRITHECKDLQFTHSKILRRRATTSMINVGGCFPAWSRMIPYSMVGGGWIHTSGGKAKEQDDRFCYQWITGCELVLDPHISVLLHHRYRKAYRAESMHSLEFGLKFSV